MDYEDIFDWENCITYFKKLNDIKPYAEPQHNIKIGDIFYNSWGWEQTNIDYYRVVATTKKMISIRQIKSIITEYDASLMSGKSLPKKDDFASEEIIKKTPSLYNDSWRINFEYGAGTLWDGNPVDFSCYA